MSFWNWRIDVDVWPRYILQPDWVAFDSQVYATELFSLPRTPSFLSFSVFKRMCTGVFAQNRCFKNVDLDSTDQQILGQEASTACCQCTQYLLESRSCMASNSWGTSRDLAGSFRGWVRTGWGGEPSLRCWEMKGCPSSLEWTVLGTSVDPAHIDSHGHASDLIHKVYPSPCHLTEVRVESVEGKAAKWIPRYPPTSLEQNITPSSKFV